MDPSSGRGEGVLIGERKRKPITLHFCLSSDVSTDIYPENTRSNFTNVLPQPLTNHENRRFYLRLKSISLTSEEFSLVPIGYVEVHIAQLEGQRSGLSYSRSAGGFIYPPKKDHTSNYGTHVFRDAPFLPLRFSQIDNFNVRLQSKTKVNLALGEGPPTLIWLEMTDDTVNSQFTIQCRSNHPTLFLANTLNNFRSPLPEAIDLTGFEVGLQQIVFPPYLKDVGEEATVTINGHTFNFDLKEYEGTSAFLRSVRQKIRAHDEVRSEVLFTVGKWGARRGKAMFQRKRDARKPRVKIQCNIPFTRACGQTRMPQGELEISGDSVLIFEGYPNIFQAMPYPVGLLTCNLIQNTVMGGQYGSFMHCVPIIENDKPTPHIYEPEVITYHPIYNRPFNSIEFHFLEMNMQPKKLISERADVDMIISLVFRKIKT